MTLRSRIAFFGALALAACSETAPPLAVADACQMFRANPGWYDSARQSERRWSAPLPIMMAIVWRESKFDANARPPRRKLLGLIPLGRLSSAYGYAQAIDGTWDWYLQEAAAPGARRDDFHHAIDFVGWYMAKTRDMTEIGRYDARNHYLAYHQGQTGYLKGSYEGKTLLLAAASEVAFMSRRYDEQLSVCIPDYEGRQAPKFAPPPRGRPAMGPGEKTAQPPA